jgi:hypothetical protein
MVTYLMKIIRVVVINQSGLLITKMIGIFKNIFGHRLVQKMNFK